MGLFSRKKAEGGRRGQKEARAATREHFAQFAASRTGVEAYYEVETPRAAQALLLVAHDGEWTRRRVPSLAEAANLAAELALPFYEVQKVGYPDAMRRYNESQRNSRG